MLIIVNSSHAANTLVDSSSLQQFMRDSQQIQQNHIINQTLKITQLYAFIQLIINLHNHTMFCKDVILSFYVGSVSAYSYYVLENVYCNMHKCSSQYVPHFSSIPFIYLQNSNFQSPNFGSRNFRSPIFQ